LIARHWQSAHTNAVVADDDGGALNQVRRDLVEIGEKESCLALGSGRRVTSPRNDPTLGCCAPERASSAPKSVSRVSSTRRWSSAKGQDDGIGSTHEPDVAGVHHVVAGGA
jgi:hypothetical protein